MGATLRNIWGWVKAIIVLTLLGAAVISAMVLIWWLDRVRFVW